MSKQPTPTTKPTVVFDLDGTLADTWPLALDLANELNLLGRQLTQKDYEHVRNLHAKEIMEYLGVPLWRVPRLMVKGRAALVERIAEVPVFPGMREALDVLKKDGFSLCIMSSNSQENIQKFLVNHDLVGYFDEVQGGIGVFAKAKTLKKLIKEGNHDISTMYYVGDEVRDVEAAKKVGLTAIAVTWGFNGEKILKEYQPDYLVRTPKELIQVLSKKNP